MNWHCAMINLPRRTDRAWVDTALAMGFRDIEFCPRHNPEGTEDVIAYAKAQGFRISIHAHHGPNNIIDTNLENRKLSMEQIKYCIDLSSRYQLGVVTFHPGRLSFLEESEEEKWGQLFEAVEEIAAYAKEKQVYVGLENMELRNYELVYTLEDLNRFAYIGKDNPYFGLTLDFAHFSSHGIYEPDLSELKLPVLNIHLSQCVDGKMHKTLAAENGAVHVPQVCRLLHDYGYTGRIIFEMGDGYQDSLDILRSIEIM